MKLCAIQPSYFAPCEPQEAVSRFLLDALENAEKGDLWVLPEYANAGGLSDPEKELACLPRAAFMKEKAREKAAEKACFVAVNVLEAREALYNSTYLYGPRGEEIFCYNKIHLPPSEIALGVTAGDGSCLVESHGIRFGFLTCYDVYYNEQIEHLAAQKPDVLVIPGYQRGERVDIIRAQGALAAFRCNAFVVRSSYSMDSDEKGGCSMIVGPDGVIRSDLGKKLGVASAEVDIKEKYFRSAGFGGAQIRNDDFIAQGLRPDRFGK